MFNSLFNRWQRHVTGVPAINLSDPYAQRRERVRQQLRARGITQPHPVYRSVPR